MKALVIALCLIFLAVPAFADNITLSWTAPTTNADGSELTDLAGFRIYWSQVSGTYDGSTVCDVPDPLATSVTCDVQDAEGLTLYFVAIAYDDNGNESAHSNEVSHSFPANPPAAPTGLAVSP